MAYLQAAIFDMDGVVTDTAELHCLSWKLMFDEFLTTYCASHGLIFQPFTHEDYLYYVDGIPRHAGVKNFLTARNISLPEGLPQDEPGKATLYGLGKRKDLLFHALLEQQGVTCFASTLSLINSLRQQNIKTAIISSSKNCQTIINKAKVSHLFDAIVDGNFMEQRQLPGKPQPDIFLQAAEQLDVVPSNAMVIEDALSGVQAGHNGKFGLVVGIDRRNLGAELYQEHGADIVVTDLAELRIEGVKHWFKYELINVLDVYGKLSPALADHLASKHLALFLDYDGTLTPIVNTPKLAQLTPEMIACLKKLSQRYPVAIISGRQLNDLQARIGLENIYYAGNHGLEIAGPSLQHNEGAEYLAEMEEVYQQLQQQLGKIEGILIENKKFSLSVHFRLVAEPFLSVIHQAISHILQQHPHLKRYEGKKVFEIRPNIDWHKGKAILWFLSALELDKADILPIYIGDDAADEDAFHALQGHGLGIIVTDHKQPTDACCRLKDPAEVQQFLELLLQGV